MPLHNRLESNKQNGTAINHYIPLAAATVVSFIIFRNSSRSSDLISISGSGINVDCPGAFDFPIPSKYALAFEESLGFFDNIPQDDWELMRNITLNRVNNVNEKKPLQDPKKPQVWYQKNWDPDFSCRHITKVGVDDGAKWICDPQRLIPQAKRRMEQYEKEGRLKNQTAGKEIRKGCLVYSVGSNGNFKFEEGLQAALPGACEIHTFDFTDYSMKVPPGNNIFFHHWGLKSSYNERKRVAVGTGFKQLDYSDKELFKTFQETIKELGHEGRPIDIFKIDCEGCEWSTYKDWINADFRQILVEVHRVPEVAQDFFSDLQKAGYVSFLKEPNIQWGADCVEYGMLKLSTKYVEDRLAAVGKRTGAVG